MISESKQFKEKQKILETISLLNVEQLLERIHNVAVALIGDTDIPDKITEEYQESMGAIEQYFKIQATDKKCLENKAQELEERLESVDIVIDGLNTQIQNSNLEVKKLKELLQESEEKKHGKEMVETEKLEAIQLRLKNSIEDAEKSRTNENLSLGKLKQMTEDYEHLQLQLLHLKEELATQSNDKMKIDKERNTLKRYFNELKNKYTTLKGQYKRLSEDSIQKTIDIEEKQSHSLSPSPSPPQEVNNIRSRSPTPPQTPKVAAPSQASLLESRVAILTGELDEKDNEIDDLHQQVFQLQNLVDDLKQKRERAISEIESLRASKSISYNFNPNKLSGFIKSFEESVNKTYKNFIQYSALKNDEFMAATEKNINYSREVLEEFKEYFELKYMYNSKKKIG